MSARARVHAMLPPLDNPTEAEARAAELDARLDAVRVEDLNEGIDRLRQWAARVGEEMAPGVNFAIGVLLAVRDRDRASKAEATFFEVGRTYRHTQTGSTIRVLAIDPHPVTGVIHAIGWLHNPASSPLVGRLNGLDWESGDWADATEVWEKSSPTRADATPDFYQPGHVYSYPRYADGYDWKFRVDTITTHPETGERIALGWRYWQGQWGEYAYGEDDWDIHNCDPAGDLIATPVEEVAR